jgi:hypothetical protein
VAFFARHAPGITPSELRRMTPAESRLVQREVLNDLKADAAERLAIAKAIVQSNGARFV